MSMDRWVWLRDDGQLILHTENDGWTYLRRGPEAVEKEVTLEQLRQDGSSHYRQALILLAEVASAEEHPPTAVLNLTREELQWIRDHVSENKQRESLIIQVLSHKLESAAGSLERLIAKVQKRQIEWMIRQGWVEVEDAGPSPDVWRFAGRCWKRIKPPIDS